MSDTHLHHDHPHHHHKEKHFTANDTVRDVVIGMSDGLTVPFALAAGLSGIAVGTSIIVTAGFAEIAAGAIAMGLGGFLAAKSEREHYHNEKERERREVKEVPHMEELEIYELMEEYGVTKEECTPLMNALKRNPTAWVNFMMKFELGLEEPDPKRSIYSAVTIGGSYIVGGLIPLMPYIVIEDVKEALLISVIITLLALFVFGFVKGKFTGIKPLWSGIETMFIGGTAAAAAFFIASLFE